MSRKKSSGLPSLSWLTSVCIPLTLPLPPPLHRTPPSFTKVFLLVLAVLPPTLSIHLTQNRLLMSIGRENHNSDPGWVALTTRQKQIRRLLSDPEKVGISSTRGRISFFLNSILTSIRWRSSLHHREAVWYFAGAHARLLDDISRVFPGRTSSPVFISSCASLFVIDFAHFLIARGDTLPLPLLRIANTLKVKWFDNFFLLAHYSSSFPVLLIFLSGRERSTV